MRTSFLHVADTRLGYRDPTDPEVFGRVAKQFRYAIDFALEQRAAFVVFAGNLFDAPNLDPDTFQAAFRGLSRLAERNIAAIAIRGRQDVSWAPEDMTWYRMLAEEGLLAVLEPAVGDGQLALSRWERREGSGSYVDLSRARVFGLHYYGAMSGVLVPALGKAIAGLDNREMDFRMALLHGPLEHFCEGFGPHLSYSDLLLLRRQLDYVALGGCDTSYEAEGWVYNPGAYGFYHVTVDTAVTPKHIARYVAYPAALAVNRPPAPAERASRAATEERLMNQLAGGPGEPRRDLLRLVTEVMWGEADAGELQRRLLEQADAALRDGSAA